MKKKQQTQWSLRGAHLLPQVRARLLNGEWEATFRTWYPGFRCHIVPAAAWKKASYYGTPTIRHYDTGLGVRTRCSSVCF